MSTEATLRVQRGDKDSHEMVEYKIPLNPGMVVLDAIHAIQAAEAPDLAVRWNCKAGKCGSCGGEVNGKPKLLCMDRMDKYTDGEPIEVRPMKTFPVIKDLATDVSWNYEVNKKIPAFKMETNRRRGPAVLSGRSRSSAGVPQVHRVLLMSERLSRFARAWQAGGVRRSAILRSRGQLRNAPA